MFISAVFVLFSFIVLPAKSQNIFLVKQSFVLNNNNTCLYSNINNDKKSVVFRKDYMNNTFPSSNLDIKSRSDDYWFYGSSILFGLALVSVTAGVISYSSYEPNQAPPRRSDFSSDKNYDSAKDDFDKARKKGLNNGIWAGVFFGCCATICWVKLKKLTKGQIRFKKFPF